MNDEQYSDRYVMDELVRVREMWGNKRAEPCWDNLFKGLGLLMLRSSDKVKPLIEATLLEATMRRGMGGYYK